MRKGGKLEGWKVEKLGDVIQKTETINPLQTPNKEFIYIDVSSVNNKTLSIEETSLIKGKDAPSRARKLIKAGDVIFATVRPTLKRIAVIPEEHDHQVCSTGYFVLRGKEFINNKYLFYYLQTDSFNERMEKLQKGASYPAVTDTEVKEQIISYPPLPEQQRIVSVLDEAFASIAQAKSNAERNLVNARELFESLVERLFENAGKGWKIEKLKRITTKIGSGATPRGGGDSYQAEGLSLIRSLNVHDMGFRMKKLAFLNDEQADKLSNVAVESGDVLLNITGASIARCCIVPDDVLPARVNQHVSIIRLVKDEMIPEFLHYALISKANKDKLLNTGEKGGSTRQALTKAQIEDFSVSYPPLAEQRAIVGRLEALSAETGRLEEIYWQKIDSFEELKKSVLAKAFDGEL